MPHDVAILVELPMSSPYAADQGASAFNLGVYIVPLRTWSNKKLEIHQNCLLKLTGEQKSI
ncbi:hypothetical protein CEH05_18050 [Halobacillus halophilus]|nr:hypothetical protein CEH05_18050 [Halobacillus halophilus]